MKKIFFLVLLGVALIPVLASAHVLKIDGSIGVTIHVDPDDDPIVGEPASFFLEIKDKQDVFRPENCTCVATISKGSEPIFSTDLFTNGSGNSLTAAPFFSYVFPERNIYTVTISGTPKTSQAFQSFSVRYDLRVARDKNTPAATRGGHFWIFGGLVIGAVVLFCVYFIRKK
jgi:hypothetical protein